MTPKRFRIYHSDIGDRPGMFQAAFATTAEVIAFSYKPGQEYRIAPRANLARVPGQT
jgi:hypothetical protein